MCLGRGELSINAAAVNGPETGTLAAGEGGARPNATSLCLSYNVMQGSPSPPPLLLPESQGSQDGCVTALRGHWYHEGDKTATLGIIRIRS